jgi:hypothetical protein
MTTEVRYEIDRWVDPSFPEPEYQYPLIARVILADGVEVSRGYPDFKEVASAAPEIIEQFFDAVSSYFHQLAEWSDTQTEFTRPQQTRIAIINMFAIYYMEHFDQDIDFDPSVRF